MKKLGNTIKFVWNNCKVWLIVSVLVTAILLSATLTATQNTFIANTISTVVGGERRVLVDGDPSKYQYYTKDNNGFLQFKPSTDSFDTDGSGRELSDSAKKKQALEAANSLNEEIVEEGIVLLKNNLVNNAPALPLTQSAPKVSVFGKNSTNIVLGGSGSGAGISKNNVSLYEGLENAGFELNKELVKFYQSGSSGKGRDANPAIGVSTTGLRIGETPYANYTSTVKNSYSDYKDAAIIVISRIGGEGFDLPRTMVSSYGGSTIEGAYDGQHYLQLDRNETQLIEEVSNAGFDKVIVLINSSTSMELGFVEDNDAIDAALWIGSPGGSGANAIGRVLKGEVNPSGRLVDTYVRDFKQDPTYQNFGDNMSKDGNVYLAGGSNSGYHFVEYEEGIYLGYRYYETRTYQEVIRFGNDNGFYENSVVYPFGYGLSYTNFEWEIMDSTQADEITNSDFEINITVNVTNKGTKPGKDVVQLYYSAPYFIGGIEKSHVVLGDYAKTGIIQPGQSQQINLSLNIEDMASYDYNDANGNDFRGYELDEGLYTLYIGQNVHQAWNQSSDNELIRRYYISENIRYEMDISGDENGNDNQFDDVSEYMDKFSSVLSREAFNTTFPTRPTVKDREADPEVISALQVKYDDMNQPYYVADSDKPVQGKSGNAPQLYELIKSDGNGGYYVDYDDERWNELLNYITVAEMVELIGTGNFNTMRIDSIGKPRTIDPDGPAGFTNFMGDPSVHDTCFYASECVIGATWNKDLAHDMGVMVGIESLVGYTKGDGRTYSGWYAPAVNIHRNPFSGRNWEYYSEDPLLSGMMGANVVAGAKSKGVYTYIKHFALNDQETNRDTNGLVTWADEQTIREIYLKPFRLTVELGKTTAMMSSFNRIGAVWAGGSYNLLTNVLRKEWGFRGMVISDYNLSNAFMPPEQMIRAGGDLNLSQSYMPSSGASVEGTNEGTQIAMLRQATKNILYTVVNSNAMNGMGEGVVYKYAIPMWQVWLIVLNITLVAGFAIWGFFAIRKSYLFSNKAKTSSQRKNNGL